MSFDDFCALSPSEFSACCKAWHDAQEQQIHFHYEVARWQALIGISPHVKRKPQLPFPWEKPKAKQPKQETVSKEESLKRFRKLMKREKKEQG